MIKAYCNRCGCEIPPEWPAQVRFVFGKTEMSGHLCEADMAELIAASEKLHVTNFNWLYPLKKNVKT